MTEPHRAVLALDQGSHASRACIVDFSGVILAEAHLPVRTWHGTAGQIEQDPDELVASLQTVADRAVASARSGEADAAELDGAELDIVAAGLAIQRSTIVSFNARSGAALSPAISWQDRRNAAWVASFAAHAERIRSLTGLPLSPHYGVGKMRWCLDHLPAVQAAHRRGELQIAPLAAFLTARLTGRPAVVDPANASRTLLWDSAQHAWSPELLALFGIDRSLLPACTTTHADYGTLQPAAGTATDSAPAAADRRTARGIALRVVTGDQSAIPFAFGPPDPCAIYLNLGTGAFIQRPLRQRPGDPAPLLASVLALEEHAAWYCLEGTVNGAGSATSLFISQRQLDEASLWPQLEQLPPERPLPIYINGVGGLGSPYWRPEQSSYFIGDGSLVERFAAVLESIVFLIASNFEYMRHGGGQVERVLISGGLSRSDWLCLRLAGCLGIPVMRVPQEATALGVAALAAPTLLECGRAHSVATLRRFEPQQLAAARASLAARRARFDACLRIPH